ncbi:MAG: hypothetical protein R2932_27310 [Caldilineaceae bacterium]
MQKISQAHALSRSTITANITVQLWYWIWVPGAKSVQVKPLLSNSLSGYVSLAQFNVVGQHIRQPGVCVISGGDPSLLVGWEWRVNGVVEQ